VDNFFCQEPACL